MLKTERLIAHARGLILTTYLRLIGVEIDGHISLIGRPPSITRRGTIKIGRNTSFRGHIQPASITCKSGALLEIGAHCAINNNVGISAHSAISIGDNCKIADNCTIIDSNYHEVDAGAGVTIKPIKIGRNVWLGRGCIILPGVEIGDHSVIGAGSVVSRSIPARSLVAGNPAVIVREISAPDRYIRP